MLFKPVLVFRQEQHFVLNDCLVVHPSSKRLAVFLEADGLLPLVPECLFAHKKLFNFISNVFQDVRLNIGVVIDHREDRLFLFHVCLRHQAEHRCDARQADIKFIECNFVVVNDVVELPELNSFVSELLLREQEYFAEVFDLRPFHHLLVVCKKVKHKLVSHLLVRLGGNYLDQSAHEFKAALACAADRCVSKVLLSQSVVLNFAEHFVEDLVHVLRRPASQLALHELLYLVNLVGGETGGLLHHFNLVVQIGLTQPSVV